MDSITNKKKGYPYIFIIDLDGTIIGDCSYQCEIYNIQDIIEKNKTQKKQQGGSIIMDNKYKSSCEKSLNNSYSTSSSNLVRPYLSYFMKKIMQLYPNSMFFIYTASEKKWAIKEISIIEKNINLKFNRPIFTRDDCIIDSKGNIRKSVVKILPTILKVAKIPQHANIRDNILVIDNNPFFIDYNENLLQCPSYNYIKFTNLWDNVPRDFLHNEELKKYVKKLIISKKMHTIENENTKEKIYKWLYKKYKKVNKINKKYIKDTFWRDLALYLEKNDVKKFTNVSVSKIQKFIEKR